MRIKTFEAYTTQDALALARAELGENAVVLNTKHLDGQRMLGFTGSGKVEVLAAVDDGAQTRCSSGEAIASGGTRDTEGGGDAGGAVAVGGAQVAVGEERETWEPARRSEESANIRELSELRDEIRRLSGVIGRAVGSANAESGVDESLLQRIGVHENVLLQMPEELRTEEDPSELVSQLGGIMASRVAPPDLSEHSVIALVGPTGVGKTTTLAKLAARFALDWGKSVGIVTADTYRIGAVEQLRTYARIMHIDMDVAVTPDDAAAAVAKLSGKDVVLIDTVGRSPRCDDGVSELKEFVDAASPSETYLVLAASSDSGFQTRAMESFGRLAPAKLVITKIDECDTRGCLVNLPFESGLKVCCVTTGQAVPQDIEWPEPHKCAQWCLEGLE